MKKYVGGKSGKLVFIGLDNAGKTTLFSLLKNGKVVASPPTGQPTSEALVIENITLTTFDLGGHKQGKHLILQKIIFQINTLFYVVRKIWTEYCPYVNAIVFIIDVADKERLMEAKEEFENILKEENLLDIPIVVLGNKIDKNGALSETETRDLFNIHKYYAQNVT